MKAFVLFLMLGSCVAIALATSSAQPLDCEDSYYCACLDSFCAPSRLSWRCSTIRIDINGCRPECRCRKGYCRDGQRQCVNREDFKKKN